MQMKTLLLLISTATLAGCADAPTTPDMHDGNYTVIYTEVPENGMCAFLLWDKFSGSAGDNQLEFIDCQNHYQASNQQPLKIHSLNTNTQTCYLATWDKFSGSAEDNQLALVNCGEQTQENPGPLQLKTLHMEDQTCYFAQWDKFSGSAGDNQITLLHCK